MGSGPAGRHDEPFFSVKNYRPFGTPNGASGTEKVKFAGEIQDSSTGLYYIFARYYDPELGRFISPDPRMGRLSVPQTQNRYVYCDNNPMKFVDPTGLDFWSWLRGVATDTPPMDPTQRPIGDNRQWPWEYSGWWVNLGAAACIGILIGAGVGEAILEGITTVGSWLGRRDPTALPKIPTYVPPASKVIAPAVQELPAIGGRLPFIEPPLMNVVSRCPFSYAQTTLDDYGLTYYNYNAANFFARVDAQCAQPTILQWFGLQTLTEGGTWTQLAKYGLEGIAGGAIEWIIHHFTETRTGIPGYSG